VRVPEYPDGAGHALCGPVAVRGATPGSVLAVRVDTVRPARWGTTFAGGRASVFNDRYGLVDAHAVLSWELDQEAMTGRDQYGHTVALRPFMGVMGLPPAEPGEHSTIPPRWHGGNLDCKELVAGSTLYLPIELPGGLVSVGDGHGLQSDGEASGTAIECPMDLAELTFDLLPDQPLPGPWAETLIGTITFGFDEDLDIATFKALEAMVTVLMHRYQLEKQAALSMASLIVDLRVTQIVNGVKGVHAILKPDALKRG
jgi:acetamidase/formamidase